MLKYASSFDRNNAISVFLMGALPSVAGSAISVLLNVFFVWGIISLLRGRYEFRLTPTDRIICWTFTMFVASVLLTALAGENRARIPQETTWLLPYLSVWVIIPRLRASRDIDYLEIFIRGAGAGAICGMVLGLIQVVWLNQRAEGGAGNAAVYAIMSLCLAAIAGLAVSSASIRLRRLAAAATIAGLVAVALSLTRGVMLASIWIGIILLVYSPRGWRSVFKPLVLLGLAASAAMVAYVDGWDFLLNRFMQTVTEIHLIVADGYSRSIGERLRLWEAGLQAIS